MFEHLITLFACIIAFLFLGGDFVLIGLYWLWRLCRPAD